MGPKHCSTYGLALFRSVRNEIMELHLQVIDPIDEATLDEVREEVEFRGGSANLLSWLSGVSA